MRWLAISRTTVLVLITVQTGAAQAAGDATRGADIFRQNCAMVPQPEPGRTGRPSLFSWSAELRPVSRTSHTQRDEEQRDRLDRRSAEGLLEGPRKYVPASR